MEQCQQQGRIQAVVLWGRFQEWFLCKSRYWFTTVKVMKYASQSCYDKTMDGKMALCRVSQGHQTRPREANPADKTVSSGPRRLFVNIEKIIYPRNIY